MSALPPELRDLIDSGPLAHLSTINADGSPQVTVIWIERDGDDLLSGHMGWYAKLRNIKRDPRVVISFTSPRDPGTFLNPYAVLRAHAKGQHWLIPPIADLVFIPVLASGPRRFLARRWRQARAR